MPRRLAIARLAIVCLHTVLAVAGTTAGAIGWGQAAVNAAWERGLYGELSQDTMALWIGSAFVVVWCCAYALACWGWLAGSTRAGVALVAFSVVVGALGGALFAALLGVAAAYVALDVWVTRHRRRAPPSH